MTDVLLRQTNDGGDIIAQAGLLQMSEGLETAAFLSMFGGNEQDAGDSDSAEQWWGNIGETETARTYRSETQFLIKSLPAIPANLLRIEQAAERDLAWMIEAEVAKSIAVAARIPELNRVVVDVTIVTLLREVTFSFG
jgi:phage gp46-like protein